jgi:hypothetical protein
MRAAAASKKSKQLKTMYFFSGARYCAHVLIYSKSQLPAFTLVMTTLTMDPIKGLRPNMKKDLLNLLLACGQSRKALIITSPCNASGSGFEEVNTVKQKLL